MMLLLMMMITRGPEVSFFLSPSCQEADPAVSDLELRSIYAKLDKNSNGEPQTVGFCWFFGVLGLGPQDSLGSSLSLCSLFLFLFLSLSLLVSGSPLALHKEACGNTLSFLAHVFTISSNMDSYQYRLLEV